MSGSWKDITKETLRHYYCDKHMSDQQIGALFNVTRNQVSYKRRYYHITRKDTLPVYNEKIIAYIRILGFNRMMQDATKHLRINQLLHVPFHLLRHDHDYKDIHVSFFGSVIVLSTDHTSIESFDRVYRYVSLLTQSYLAYYGVLLRGAICIGHLYHDDQFVFGPAFAKAQSMEKNVARFPRVIIDAGDLHIGLKTHHAKDKNQIKDRFIFSDDGYYYLDCFYNNKKQHNNLILQRAKGHLSSISVENQHDYEKIVWMKKELERPNPPKTRESY